VGQQALARPLERLLDRVVDPQLALLRQQRRPPAGARRELDDLAASGRPSSHSVAWSSSACELATSAIAPWLWRPRRRYQSSYSAARAA
jgi:hypothetical protein